MPYRIGLLLLLACVSAQAQLFLIGKPDESATEFGLAEKRWPAYATTYTSPVVFTVGKDSLSAWPYIHPSTHDKWAGGKPHTFTIKFNLAALPSKPQFFIIGLLDVWTPPEMVLSVNGTEFARKRLTHGSGNGSGDPRAPGKPSTLVFALPTGALKPGQNTLAITLLDGSWVMYDYLYLGPDNKPLSVKQERPELLAEFLAGPLAGVEEVIFATRTLFSDGHWYANFGYYAFDENSKTYGKGGRLCKLNLKTGKLTVLLEDLEGAVRDPAVHYDGRTIVFSYRKGGTDPYHLYTIDSDGKNLRQLTDGIYDDYEPSWLPDGGIVFVSARGRRWVNCWLTQVGNIFRCDADGKNIRQLSANLEHDNTPWVLPDGRILYMRWEYVDRSQVHYHHLWTMNPDGTAQTVFFGNFHPGGLYIDAKPIPNTDRVVFINSPGHGAREHAGYLATVSPKLGPDQLDQIRNISRTADCRDPWAFSEDAFMVAQDRRLRLFNGKGENVTLFTLPPEFEGCWLHEPRPLIPRPREPILPSRIETGASTGAYLLDNVYYGRNMAGVKPGEIKKLLVLEALPKPINYTGGMDPLSYSGTFSLERVLGTVPVEPDGSAYFEAPAMKSIFFVALDDQDMAVKRMQSFTTVQPGETLGCTGCHEHRATARPVDAMRRPLAARRAPSPIEPITGAPDLLDFPRDVQPVLDALCVRCHGYEKTADGGPRAGRLILSGDRGPMFSHSYYMMTIARLFSDGRNKPASNYPPRALGSGASRIFQKLNGSHHGVVATDQQKKILRLWIDTGAAYPGTYAALGCGVIGGYQQNQQVNVDTDWPTTRAGAEVMGRRCTGCHKEPSRLLPRSLSDERGVSFWQPDMKDPRLNTSRHIVFNLTRPEKSILLLAPLSETSGGWGICRTNGTPVFADTTDPDYQKLLAMCVAGRDHLNQIKRFDMPGFRPRRDWVREMKRYGILPPSLDPDRESLDVYEAERRYWDSLWRAGLSTR